jgi:hypothetical protein
MSFFTPFAFYNQLPTSTALILDLYPNAGFAFSVRKLRSAYTGYCMQIKRSSDNAVQDIGFDSNGYLDTAAIASFVGANSATISIWYDQSGNSINLTPTGTIAGFRIVISGTLQTLNGKAAPYTLNGYNYGLGTNSFATTTNNLMWVDVSGCDDDGGSTNSYGRILSMKNTANANDYDNCNSMTNFYGLPFSKSITTYQNGAGAYTGRGYSLDTQYISFNYKNEDTIGGNINGGSNVTANSGCGTTGLNINQIRLGNNFINSDSSLDGWIQEVILWTTYTAANQSGIQSNCNAYYGTY